MFHGVPQNHDRVATETRRGWGRHVCQSTSGVLLLVPLNTPEVPLTRIF